MFAINHAATGLIVKKISPDVPMPAILVSVQLTEILRVALNFLGVERKTTENKVESVSDVHLEHMSWASGRLCANRRCTWDMLPPRARPRQPCA